MILQLSRVALGWQFFQMSFYTITVNQLLLGFELASTTNMLHTFYYLLSHFYTSVVKSNF
jgi:hypothetical protein